jgi:hypothetical protein
MQCLGTYLTKISEFINSNNVLILMKVNYDK